MDEKIIINSKVFASKDEIHEYIKREFQFPDYYGKNLSALYDCLTDIDDETFVELRSGEYQNSEMDDYFQRVAVVFIDAQLVNDNLHVMVNRNWNDVDNL